MRSIGYAAPPSVDAAIALLSANRGARMLAGGTDLIVQVREHLRDHDVFVDAKKIPELMALSLDANGTLTVGAAVPCHRIYDDARIRRAFPALSDAATIIGGIAIQSRASIGGNLCNSGPAADSIPALIAHGTTCMIAGPSGTREVPVEDFCTAPGRNVLAPGELLVALRLPAAGARSGSSYLRFIPREEMDIAVVGVGAHVSLEGTRIASARVALGAVGPTPLFARAAGDALVGETVGATAYARAAEAARAAASPITDMRGTAEHRRHLVGVLTTRALERAVERAIESTA